MKILYAGAIDLDVNKGDTVHFLHLARALQSRGHEVVVVAHGRPVCGSADGLKVYSVPKASTSRAILNRFLDDGSLLLTLVRLTLSIPFDVLYQRGIPLINSWSRLLRRLPSIVEVNGIYADELSMRGVRGWKLQLYRHREMQIIKNAHRLICITGGIRDQLASRYTVPYDQCIVLSNAADTEVFRPLSKTKCRQQVGLASERYHIGFVGTLQPWIDFDSLLEAIQTLCRRPVPLYCTLVGDGVRKQELQQQIENRQLTNCVQLVGRVPHDVVPYWVGAFDVCVAPFTRARNELIGLSPLKLFEYMACGRPVVATALPGIIEPVETAQAGLLYGVEDANMLADRLLTLYRDVGLREAMGARGREYAVKHHSWDSVAERTEAIAFDLLAG